MPARVKPTINSVDFAREMYVIHPAYPMTNYQFACRAHKPNTPKYPIAHHIPTEAKHAGRHGKTSYEATLPQLQHPNSRNEWF
jgi:hypothetical protein